MRHILAGLVAAALGLALAVPASARQRTKRIDAAEYAELEEAILYLEKAEALNPGDPSVRYFMTMTYSLQFTYWSETYAALVERNQAQSEEGKRAEAELQRLGRKLLELVEPVDAPPPPPAPEPHPDGPASG